MATTARIYRVSDEIQKTVTKVLAKDISDPRLKWVSITGVDVSKDLSAAKIYYSSLSDEISAEELDRAFDKAKGLFRKYISKEIHLRITPSIRFIYDASLFYGNKMDKLITEARLDDKQTIDHSDSEEDSIDNKNQKNKDGRKRLR